MRHVQHAGSPSPRRDRAAPAVSLTQSVRSLARTAASRGERDYDRRFEDLAASGMDMHGEAALVASYAPPASVLDAGCGTGRVAIELSRRGHAVVGVDVDEAMLEAARAKAPDLAWVQR